MNKWVKETPAKNGWYWIRYKVGRRNEIHPAFVMHLKETTCVVTARNKSFFEGKSHGGPGLKHDGKLDKSVRFWPMKLETPKYK